MKAGFIFNRKVAYGEIGEDDGEMWYCISHAPTQQDFAAIASIMDNMSDAELQQLMGGEEVRGLRAILE